MQHNLIQALFCMLSVIVYSFASNFLLFKGYTSSQIGIIVSCASFSSILLQPIIANFVDRTKKFSVIEVMMVLYGICLVLCLPLYLIKSEGLALTLTFLSIYCITDASTPLLNIVGSKIEEFGVVSDYGFARAFGSISFAIFNAILGNVINRYNENAIAISGIISYFLMFALLVWMNKTFKASKKVVDIKNEEESITLKQFILNNKKMLLLFIAIALFLFTDNIVNIFLIQIITPLQGNSVDQGYLALMWALLEVPTMMGFSKLNKKFSVETLLVVSSIIFLIRAIGLYLANNMLWVYLSLSLQWGSFALLQPAIVEYINSNTKPKERARGQALRTTICCIGMMITNLIGGFIIDIYSVKALLLIGAIITAVGTIMFILLLRSMKKKDSRKNKSDDKKLNDEQLKTVSGGEIEYDQKEFPAV